MKLSISMPRPGSRSKRRGLAGVAALGLLASTLLASGGLPATAAEQAVEPAPISIDDMTEVSRTETADGEAVVTYQLAACVVTYYADAPWREYISGSYYIKGRSSVSVGTGCSGPVSHYTRLDVSKSGVWRVIASGSVKSCPPGHGCLGSNLSKRCAGITNTYTFRSVAMYAGVWKASSPKACTV